MTSTANTQIAVIGGGISGMATALAIEDEARRRGLEPPSVTLLEGSEVLGGKIRTIRAEGFSCEWGVNGFLNKEPLTLELCQRLELMERLLPASGAYNNRFIFTRGKLRSVQMHPLKFLFSGLLPFSAKLRLMRELWVKKRTEQGEESVADFARRRVGPQAYAALVDPMQSGIYAGDPERMSVAASFPRVVEVEQQYGSLIKGMAKLAKERRNQGAPAPGAGPSGHLTSFTGGMQTLVDKLTAALGDRARTGCKVSALTRTERGYEVLLDQGPLQRLQAEVVVLACPAYAAAKLVTSLDPALDALLQEIPYSPLAVACLGYPRAQVQHPLDGFGFLAPRDAGLRILGALWTSTLFPERVPEDQVLLRVMIGGARDPEVLDLDDAQLGQLVQDEVDRVHGGTGQPSFMRIFRHHRAIPMYTLGHGDRVARVEERAQALGRLVITGNAYRGVGVNDCVKNAQPAATAALDQLAE